MIFKANSIPIILLSFLFGLFITSCGADKQKVDDAFDRIKKERMLLTDTNFVSKEIIQESMNTVPVKTKETLDEWTKFKIETEYKIRLNDNKIKQIKGLPNANARLLKKVAGLEKDNNDLKIEIEKYNEEVKVKWEMFKVSTNHHINEIGIELDALKVKGKH
jgi:hypothetical protein